MDTTKMSQNFLLCMDNETNIFHEKLLKIWDQVGVNPELRSARYEIIHKHIKQLYKDVLTEAEDEQKRLLESIEKLRKEMFELEKELRIENVGAYGNIPFDQVKEDMKHKIKIYHIILTSKRAEINNLLSREKELCQALGLEPKSLPISPLPPKEDIERFKLYLEELGTEKFIREDKLFLIKTILLDITWELKYKPSLAFEKMVIFGDCSDFVLTDENLSQLEKLFSSLKAKRESIRCEIEELREQVKPLWTRLDENTQYISEFTGKYSGISIPTKNALVTEIHRCQTKIKENIKILVEKKRDEIRGFWEICRFGLRDRAKFVHYTSNSFTENLLVIHERKAKTLKKYYDTNKEIFDLIHKREKIWDKMLDLEKRSNESHGFKNRGGQLLMEEEERNSIVVVLPKIEEKLLSLVEVYEKKKRLRFKLDGQPIRLKINRDWEGHSEIRQLQLSAMESAVEQSTSQERTILAPVTSALKLASPNTKTPTKRKMITHHLGSSGAKNAKISRENEKQLEKNMQLQIIKQKQEEMPGVSGYQGFQVDLENKPLCRSTLSLENGIAHQTQIHKEDATSVGYTTTPTLSLTYSKITLSVKSPVLR